MGAIASQLFGHETVRGQCVFLLGGKLLHPFSPHALARIHITRYLRNCNGVLAGRPRRIKLQLVADLHFLHSGALIGEQRPILVPTTLLQLTPGMHQFQWPVAMPISLCLKLYLND